MNKKLTLMAAILASAPAVPAAAAVTTFTSLEAFLAATPAATTVETFNGRPTGSLPSPGPVINASGFKGFGITGVRNGDYIGINHGLTVGTVDGTDFLGWSGIDDGTGPAFTFTFDAPITAFAFDYNDRDGSDAYQVSLAGQVFANPPFSGFTGSGFFGVVSDTPFNTVTFSHSIVGGILEPFGIDNVRSNVFAAPVPEPASWAMMIAGFGLVGGALRGRTTHSRTRFA